MKISKDERKKLLSLIALRETAYHNYNRLDIDRNTSETMLQASDKWLQACKDIYFFIDKEIDQ